ncbi:D-alanyl-D-alanine carboxypeptidase family protein [Ruminococcus albus]|uniref:D-alanyl-D-alanine carboxypeptidase n=1 Tax=Ruminococcus albus TaxID=1264 RepID=A0A1I1I7P2_RUMAL|nr:D-alanyl-D-alanine carboxypeptidase family protein [Ruminococcus albus]SFC29240.1 D-alanyl-D-alanine carboxypeptidase [Ruminococcus albus]
MKKGTKLIISAAAAVTAAVITGTMCAFAAEAGNGDVNGDGRVNITDITLTAAFVKGKRLLSAEEMAAADVNGDGSVNTTDITRIAAFVKGKRNLDGSEFKKDPEPEPEPSGPVIEVKNGVTYVNGILVVNKSYALPENYGNGLTAETQKAFNNMQAAAWNDGISLNICSGFRSYSYQSQLYWSYVNRDGQWAADTYSARPGHSEHQTGLAIDINNASTSFNGSREAQWIAAHCADYGFILRYPYGKEDKTGFMYESWHVRYVGKDLARKITDSGLCLEEYLGIDSYYH